MDTFETAASRIGEWVVLTVRGELDMVTGPVLSEAISTAFVSSPALVIDVSGLQFIDSTGLTVLMVARNDAAAIGGSLRIVTGPAGAARRLLAMTAMDQVFDVAVDVATATSGSSVKPQPQG